jgi:lipoprotein signal peptidase
MAWSLRRWRPRQLLLAWVAYWIGLAAVTLGPAIRALMRATGTDAKGSMNASAGDQGLSITITADGGAAWSGSASLTAIVFWLVGPPLLLWLVWFVRRKPRDELLSEPNAKALSEGEAQPLDVRQRQKDPASRA